MKVKDLITQLQSHNPNDYVVITDAEGNLLAVVGLECDVDFLGESYVSLSVEDEDPFK